MSNILALSFKKINNTN